MTKEERRLKMLETAAALFLEHGYERTSMDEINLQLGCSKTTLYKYYPSKEELFCAAIHHVLNEQIINVLAAIKKLNNSKQNCWQALTLFGINYLQLHLSPPMLSVMRIIISEAERVQIGPIFGSCGSMKGWQEVADFLELLMHDGLLRKTDPLLASMQLKGLFDSGVIDKRLYGVVIEMSDKKIRQQVEMAIDTFRRAYQVKTPC